MATQARTPGRSPRPPAGRDPAQDAQTPRPPTKERVIKISDVLKALEIAAERLGDAERSCATLRAWAQAGRVTPAGQLLTPAAVDAGIEKWLRRRRGEKSPEPPAASVSAVAAAARPKRPRQETAAAAPAQPEKKRPTYAETKKARQEEEARARELTAQRLQEVSEEIGGHMEDILRRSMGQEAVQELRSAPADADRRELYARLMHAKQDPDVRVPEELCAELLPHQVEGLEWLASLYGNSLHGILADEMGLGKTIQTISLLLHIKERKGNSGPHLIVAPKSTLSNWKTEFGRFAPGFSVRVLTGDQEGRGTELAALRKDIAEGRAVACVTNYEQVYRNEWLLKNSWQLIVVDEGHRLKNPETVLHNAMAQLKCRMRLLLTGTPLQNSVNELWALLHYLLPDLFTVMMDFKAWFAKPFQGVQGLNEFEVQLDPEQEQQVIRQMHALLSPFLLQRLKSEVLADRLPPRVEMDIRVPLSAWQTAAYRDLEKRTICLLGENDSVSSDQVNNALMQLRKIVLHPYLFQQTYPRDEGLYRASGKLEALDRLLPKLLAFDHKVLIFSQFTSVLSILEDFLNWRRIEHVRLDGQVAHEQRCARIERFNSDSRVKVFLLSARAGGLGLNLQSADTVILFDIDWNPQNDKQAIARVHRVGQTKEVRVVRLVTDSKVERHMEARCKEKLEMEKKIMGAGMFRKQATTEQRSAALRTVLGLDAGPVEGAGASAGGQDVTPLEEANKLLARSNEELEAFRAMDSKSLKPPRGSSEGDRPTAELLERCNRLMRPTEVPEGFSVTSSAQEE